MINEELLDYSQVSALIGVTKYKIQLADWRRVIHAKCGPRYGKRKQILRGKERRFLRTEVLERAEDIRRQRCSKEYPFAIAIFKTTATFLGATKDMIERWFDEISEVKQKSKIDSTVVNEISDDTKPDNNSVK